MIKHLTVSEKKYEMIIDALVNEIMNRDGEILIYKKQIDELNAKLKMYRHNEEVGARPLEDPRIEKRGQ